MALHTLQSVTIGVRDVGTVADFYADFGLARQATGELATGDGGTQLRLVPSPRRRLLGMTVSSDDADDLARIAARAQHRGLPVRTTADTLSVTDPWAAITVTVRTGPRPVQPPAVRPRTNGPGRVERTGPADVVHRRSPVRPRRLGHCVVGSPHAEELTAFFTEVVGFKVSDRVRDGGAFLRCSVDHHNLLINPAPVTFLHHTAWEVDDVDEVGRGATAMIEQNPARHVWGFGRHCIGSNFFWYLRDPAGNFAEYYSDLDVIPEDTRWDPQVWEGARGLYLWGPPPPPSFIRPDDLADLMIGTHGGSR